MAKAKTTEIDLQELKEELVYNWKTQTANQHSAIMVAYIDARDGMDRLDKVCGPENWQSLFYELKGRIFCSISILLNGQWVSKSDCGSESNIEKEKGEASDAFKRAGVQWGIGRFLYKLPELRWRETIQYGKTRTGAPAYRFAHNGKIVWDKAEITALCNERMVAIKAGKAIDEPVPPQASPPAQKKTEPSAVDKETIERAKKIATGCLMLANGDQEKAKDILEEHSGFEAKDNTFVPGKRSVRELAQSPARLKPTWHRIQATMKKQGAELPADMRNDEPPQEEIDGRVDREPEEHDDWGDKGLRG